MQGLLQATAITRRFGATLALAGVDFSACPGEIHALVGENGAGKTTLMNVIAGYLRPDQGTVRLDGSPLKSGSAIDALTAGIATVHQSPMLFERLGVEENLALGGFVKRGLGLAEVRRRAAAMAAELGFEVRIDRSAVEELSLAERVRLEILRALSFDPRVLILDEPTALLAPNELSGFLNLLAKLRGRGRSIILITHKLAEAMAVADRITVLRAGRVVAQTRPKQTSEAAIARLMVGGIVQAAARGNQPGPVGAERLRIDGLGLECDGRAILDGISLRLLAGEIVGVAGVDGNGQLELMQILAGARGPTRGQILLNGRPANWHRAEPIAAIPQNRDQDGLILDLELWENLLLSAALRKKYRRMGLQARSQIITLCRDLITRFGIHASGPRIKAAALSGGHRQRLMVARALAVNSGVLVGHDLTRGLDVAAAADVHRMLAEFSNRGGAVLLISSDLDEILGLCDRMAVISGGRLVEVSPDERYPERVGLLMAGARP